MEDPKGPRRKNTYPMSVSYTHLDVYKRQILVVEVTFDEFFRNSFYGFSLTLLSPFRVYVVHNSLMLLMLIVTFCFIVYNVREVGNALLVTDKVSVKRDRYISVACDNCLTRIFIKPI